MHLILLFLATIDVVLYLFQDDALAFACSQLMHRFPKVRRYAAEHIYVCLLEQADLLVENGSTFPLETLLEFPWDGERTSVQQCQETAQKVADLVGVSLPDLRKTPATRPRKKIQDDFAAYSALVDANAN